TTRQTIWPRDWISDVCSSDLPADCQSQLNRRHCNGPLANREKWYAGETISVAIGQGAVTVTPIQLASAIGGVASGGVWYRPHLRSEERRVGREGSDWVARCWS